MSNSAELTPALKVRVLRTIPKEPQCLFAYTTEQVKLAKESKGCLPKQCAEINLSRELVDCE